VQSNEDSLEAATSADGRYVALSSNASNLVAGDTNEASDVFLRDRRAGTTTRISVSRDGAQALGPSYGPAISADGRYVTFTSRAANLVPGDTNNDVSDVFLRNIRTAATRRVSVSTAGGQATSDSWGAMISAHGRDVAFISDASNLVPGDTNDVSDVFLRNLRIPATSRISVSSTGAQAQGPSYDLAISGGANRTAPLALMPLPYVGSRRR
jgi:Tol biopolymer transport system component